MAILAQRCPVRELLAMTPGDREARLFGAARGRFVRVGPHPDARAYRRELWDHWWTMLPGSGDDPASGDPLAE